MLKRRLAVGLIFSIVLCYAPALVWGQGNNASVGGTVQDPTGAAVPHAQLTLRLVGIGAKFQTTSGPDGLYEFLDLQPGIYELTVSASGFRQYLQSGISLNLDQKARIDVSLVLGSTQQTVEVTANASALNYENAEQKGTVAPQTIEQLPLIVAGITRSAVSFERLEPGVTSGGNEDRKNFNTRINGGMTEGDEATLDGVSIIDGAISQNGMLLAVTGHPFSPDAIEEITLITANYDAQYGSTASSVTKAITKSGTDSWHGSLYGFVRNKALNARQFGLASSPVDNEVDFGGALGGPVKIPKLWSGQNRTYGFVNYEGYRVRGGLTTPVFSFPTMAERGGDFSDWKDSSGNLIPVYDPATTQPVSGSPGSFTRSQFMGCNGTTPNVICPTDPRLTNSLALGWLKYLPPPNRPGIVNNYTSPRAFAAGAVVGDSTVLDVRVDQYIHEKDHFTATVHYYGTFGDKLSLNYLPFQIANDDYLAPNYGFANRLNWDHIFRPNLLNNFNLGYNDILWVSTCTDAPYAGAVPQIAGAANHNLPPIINLQDYFGSTSVGAGGGGSLGCNSKGSTARPVYIANDRLAWVRGKHTLGLGVEYRALESMSGSLANESGTTNFSRLNTGLLEVNSGSSMASWLLGDVSSATESIYTLASQYIRQKYLAIYASDTWKITPKLTFNYGLRYDLSPPSREKWNNVAFIDPFQPNTAAGNRPGDLVFAGTNHGSASFGKPYPENIDYRNFAPRVGLAYAITPKTVVRAGYGIFYQLQSYAGWTGGIYPGTDGFNNSVLFSSTNGGLTPAINLSQGFTGQTISQPPFFDTTYDNGRFPGLYREFNGGRVPYMQQYNFSLEHQFTKDFYMTGAYVANKGTRLISKTAPINVLNPSLLSRGNALYDEFKPGQTTLDGVSVPYAGWVGQMQQCPPTVAQALLPYPQFCGVLQSASEDAGNSTFNSLQVKAEKRVSHGIWLLSSYTWSKFLTTGSDIQAQWSWASEVSPFQRNRNKALDPVDVPQTWSTVLVYQLPFGKGERFLNKGGVVDKLAGGWQFTTVVRIQSGLPFNFTASACNIPSQFSMGCFPGILPGANPFAQSKGNFDPTKPLFNPAAFENGTTRSFSFYSGAGSVVSNLRGFGYHNQDIALQKTFSITERLQFQLRADFFNAWNWHIFSSGTTWGYSPPAFNTDLSSPGFGIWSGAVTVPRNIQVAARITF